MAVYALLFWGIERVVWVIFYRPREAPVALTQRTSSEQRYGVTSWSSSPMAEPDGLGLRAELLE